MKIAKVDYHYYNLSLIDRLIEIQGLEGKIYYSELINFLMKGYSKKTIDNSEFSTKLFKDKGIIKSIEFYKNGRLTKKIEIKNT